MASGVLLLAFLFLGAAAFAGPDGFIDVLPSRPPTTQNIVIKGWAADEFGGPVAEVRVTIRRLSNNSLARDHAQAHLGEDFSFLTGLGWSLTLPVNQLFPNEAYEVRVEAEDAQGAVSDLSLTNTNPQDFAPTFTTNFRPIGVIDVLPSTIYANVALEVKGWAQDPEHQTTAVSNVQVVLRKDGATVVNASAQRDVDLGYGSAFVHLGWRHTIAAGTLEPGEIYTLEVTARDQDGLENTLPLHSGNQTFTVANRSPIGWIAPLPIGPPVDHDIEILGWAQDPDSSTRPAVTVTIKDASGNVKRSGLAQAALDKNDGGYPWWRYTIPANTAGFVVGATYTVEAVAADPYNSSLTTSLGVTGGISTFTTNARPIGVIDVLPSTIYANAALEVKGWAQDPEHQTTAVSNVQVVLRKGAGTVVNASAQRDLDLGYGSAFVHLGWRHTIAAGTLEPGEIYTLEVTARDQDGLENTLPLHSGSLTFTVANRSPIGWIAPLPIGPPVDHDIEILGWAQDPDSSTRPAVTVTIKDASGNVKRSGLAQAALDKNDGGYPWWRYTIPANTAGFVAGATYTVEAVAADPYNSSLTTPLGVTGGIPTFTTNARPTGVIDVLPSTIYANAALEVKGWARDPEHQTTAVSNVQVVLRKGAGTVVNASAQRDLDLGYGSAFVHLGWRHTIAAGTLEPGEIYTLEVTARDQDGLENTLPLHSGSLTFTVANRSPIGWIAPLPTEASTNHDIEILGWAQDPDSSTRPAVTVTIKDASGNVKRSGLAQAALDKNDGGYPWWRYTIPANAPGFEPNTTYTVEAVAVDPYDSDLTTPLGVTGGVTTFTTNSVPFGYIASFPVGMRATEDIVLRGWARDTEDGDNIQSVKVSIWRVGGNGTPVIGAEVASTREYFAAGYETAGWSFRIAAGRLIPGATYRLQVIAFDQSGMAGALALYLTTDYFPQFTLPNDAPVGRIDVLPESISYLRSFTFTGWAADPDTGSPVPNLSATIQKIAEGETPVDPIVPISLDVTKDIASPLVAAVAERSDYGRAGWTATIPTSALPLSPGTYSITVTAEDSGQRSTSLPVENAPGGTGEVRTFEVVNDPPQGVIETLPVNVNTAAAMRFRGWAADPDDGSPVDTITATIEKNGQPPISLLVRKNLDSPEVAEFFHRSDYAHAGWTAELPTGVDLPEPGTYTLTVSVADSAALTNANLPVHSGSHTFQIGAPNAADIIRLLSPGNITIPVGATISLRSIASLPVGMELQSHYFVVGSASVPVSQAASGRNSDRTTNHLFATGGTFAVRATAETTAGQAYTTEPVTVTVLASGGTLLAPIYSIHDLTYDHLSGPNLDGQVTETHPDHEIWAGPAVRVGGDTNLAQVNVAYSSAHRIRLLPGFSTVRGTTFSARVNGDAPDIVIPPLPHRDRLDGGGGGSASPGNQLPLIAWVSGPTSAVVGTEFSVQARATDADGNLRIIKVWRDGELLVTPGYPADSPTGTLTTPMIPFTPRAPGRVRYTARAFDSEGATSALAERIVAVDWSGERAPSGPLGGATLPGVPTVPPAGTLVGALPGSFSVDSKGAANYSIPLAIPPGRGGMQPSLSLNYNSSGGNGPLGVGLSLSTGFPHAITRGRTILARDGDVRGVTYTSDDKLYLDGKRLLRLSGTEGMPGSVYRTEVDSFVTVTAYGTDTIDGFRMLTKDGLMLCFGKGVKDRAENSMDTLLGEDGFHSPNGGGPAAAWALKWVEDTVGNYVEFRYDETNLGGGVTPDFGLAPGEHLLTSIRYTGNRRLLIAPQFTAWLRYDNPQNLSGIPTTTARPDGKREYQAGRFTTLAARLDDICLVGTGDSFTAPPRVYRFTYHTDLSAPTLLRLVGVTRKDGSGADATTIATRAIWGSASLGVGIPGANYTPTVSAFETDPGFTGDFDGDGRSDILFHNGPNLKVVSRDAAGSWREVTSTISGASLMQLVTTGDFDGDGRTDLVWMKRAKGSAGGGWYVALSTGAGFGPLQRIAANYENNISADKCTPSSAMAVDLDGDGRDELMFQVKVQVLSLGLSWLEHLDDSDAVASDRISIDGASPDGGSSIILPNGPLHLARPTFVGGVLQGTPPETELSSLLFNQNDPVSLRRVDLDGDGRSDFIATSFSAQARGGSAADLAWSLSSYRNIGNDSFVYVEPIAEGGGMVNFVPPSSGHLAMMGDVNGDGLDDLVYLMHNGSDADSNSGWRIALSKGDGSFEYSAYSGIPEQVMIGGTQRTTFSQRPGRVETQENDPGSDGPSHFITAIEGFDICGVLLFDLNGDGRKDFLWHVKDVGWRCFLAGRTGFDTATAIPVFGAASDPTEYYGQWGDPVIEGFRYDVIATDAEGAGRESLLLFSRRVPYALPSHSISLALNPTTDPYRIVGIVNGLGAREAIEYTAISNESIYTPGASVGYPIREMRRKVVVSDLWKDAGGDFTAGTWAHFSYQYSGNRIDLSGRGALGFHSFVTLDHQTGLFKYQFVAQSFPMTGLTHREETYRWWTDGSRDYFRFLSSHDNTVVFDKVSGGNGTLWPFISHAIESRWEDSSTSHFDYPVAAAISHPEDLFPQAPGTLQRKPGGAHITITADSKFDTQSAVQMGLPASVTGFNPNDTDSAGENTVTGTLTAGATFGSLPGLITNGNLASLSTDYGDGFSESVTMTYKPVTTNGLSGLVDTVRATATSANAVYGAQTAPIKSYTYSSVGGNPTPLVATETVDARDSTVTNHGDKLKLITTYDRDDRGRVREASIAAPHDPDIGTYVVSSVPDSGWDDRFDVPTTTRNAAPYEHSTRAEYHAFFGLPTSVTDVNGAETTTDYDALGRVHEVTDVLKGLTSTSAFAFDTSVTVAPPDGSEGIALTSAYKITVTSTVKPTVTTYYDRLGRPIRTTKEGRDGRLVCTDTVYNVLGQVVATSLPYVQVEPGATASYWTRTFYDRLGRVASVIAPNGTITTTAYRGRITQVTVDAQYAFGASGDGTKVQTNTTFVDAKGRTVKVWNADIDNLELTPLPGSDVAMTSDTQPSIAFDLDGFGRMRTTRLRDQSQLITATYDALGGQLTLDDPDKGHWSYTNNVLGQVVRQEDARHNVTESTFDRLGRPLVRITREDSGGPVETAKWFYYDTTTLANASGNAALQLVPTVRTDPQGAQGGWLGALQRQETSTLGAPGYAGANSAATSVHYYDAKGRPSIELTTVDGKWFYTFTNYDDHSRVEQVRYHWRPTGAEDPTVTPYAWQDFGYNYAYDTKNYVTSMTDTVGGRVWWDNPTYDHLDRVISVRKGTGFTTTRSYRPEDGALTAIKTGPTAGSSALQNLSFGYDGLGNLTSRGVPGRTESLVYDKLNRLTRNWQGEISYFDNGNIRQKRDVNQAQSPVEFQYGDEARPHAVTNAFGYTMSYDANGNVQSRGRLLSAGAETWNFRYAGFDKPRWMAKSVSIPGVGTTTTGSEFVYDANRSRAVHLEFDQLDGNGAPSHYVRKRVYGFGGALELNYENPPGTVGAPAWAMKKVRIYVSGPDGTIGVREFDNPTTAGGTEKALVYHHDHLGSIDLITDFGSASAVSTDGAGKQGRFSEDAWGQRRNPNTWNGAPTTTDDGGADGLTPRGFTGHEMLDDLGLVHMNGRIYDPLIGRMLNADILIEDSSSLQAYNRYTYVNNNPLTMTDPGGFESYSPINPATWVLPNPATGYWKGGVPGEGVFCFHKTCEFSKVFPEGVPFTKGMADFSSIQENPNFGGKARVGSVSIPVSGNHGKDVTNANRAFAEANGMSVSEVREMIQSGELTWHHNADGRMILVKTRVNAGIKHSGYAAFARWRGRMKGAVNVRTGVRLLGLLGLLQAISETDVAAMTTGMPTTTFGDGTITGWADRISEKMAAEYAVRYGLDMNERLVFLERIRTEEIERPNKGGAYQMAFAPYSVSDLDNEIADIKHMQEISVDRVEKDKDGNELVVLTKYKVNK